MFPMFAKMRAIFWDASVQFRLYGGFHITGIINMSDTDNLPTFISPYCTDSVGMYIIKRCGSHT